LNCSSISIHDYKTNKPNKKAYSHHRIFGSTWSSCDLPDALKVNFLWDKFWSGGISNPLQAIEQMSYLIFMRRLEDEDISREQNARLVGGKYLYFQR
jgi:hypothetical protein